MIVIVADVRLNTLLIHGRWRDQPIIHGIVIQTAESSNRQVRLFRRKRSKADPMLGVLEKLIQNSNR